MIWLMCTPHFWCEFFGALLSELFDNGLGARA